jgi:3-dehydroquinate synthase
MFVPFGLPISIQDIDIEKIIEYLRSDKKNSEGHIRFILLKKIGKGIISDDVTEDEIRDAVRQIVYEPNE